MKVTAEDYPSLAEHMSLQIQEAAKTQTEQDPKKHEPRPLIKLQKIRDKEKNFESKQEEKKDVLPMEKQRFKEKISHQKIWRPTFRGNGTFPEAERKELSCKALYPVKIF